MVLLGGAGRRFGPRRDSSTSHEGRPSWARSWCPGDLLVIDLPVREAPAHAATARGDRAHGGGPPQSGERRRAPERLRLEVPDRLRRHAPRPACGRSSLSSTGEWSSREVTGPRTTASSDYPRACGAGSTHVRGATASSPSRRATPARAPPASASATATSRRRISASAAGSAALPWPRVKNSPAYDRDRTIVTASSTGTRATWASPCRIGAGIGRPFEPTSMAAPA